jgi:polar amino acid transport system substrate-binding protein
MRIQKSFLISIGLCALAGCASLDAPRADLAPSGKLRAAINLGNPVLASRDAAGQPKGVSVDLARGSAYDLYLSRSLKQAQFVRVPTSRLVVDTFMAENLEVAAGVKQQLEMDAKRVPGVRLLPGRFMVINQAMASQRGKEAGARYLREFIEDMKASGFVARALERHGIEGAAVAPAGDAK